MNRIHFPRGTDFALAAVLVCGCGRSDPAPLVPTPPPPPPPAPVPPDGMGVWGEVIEFREDGTVLCDGHALRGSEDPWGEGPLQEKFEAIADSMAREPLWPDTGSGPPVPGEWLVVRLAPETPFVYLAPFLDACQEKGAHLGKIAFDVTGVGNTHEPYVFVRLPLQSLWHGQSAPDWMPCWIVEPEVSRIRRFHGEPGPWEVVMCHIYDLVGSDVQIFERDARSLAQHPEVTDDVLLLCAPQTPWCEVAQALDEIQRIKESFRWDGPRLLDREWLEAKRPELEKLR